MRGNCDLCQHELSAGVYRPDGSQRGLSIHICEYCGLVQSLPRIDRAPRAVAAVSSGADWGNVRYGKAFRTDAAIASLKRHLAFEQSCTVLDVGSNRGSFVKAFREACPDSDIVAVEPDERVASACQGLSRTSLICERIENVDLPQSAFDLIHSCHTIEHLAEPHKVLSEHWRCLKDGGLLLIDAPDIAILDEEDIVEEWFIDKHLYHFSVRTLMRMITAAGFDIVEPPDANDHANLLIVARKSLRAPVSLRPDPLEVAEAQRLVAKYVSNRARNLAQLTLIASQIASLAPRRVAMWGAGRLFDSLVTHGQFQPQMLTTLIDKHLRQYVQTRHGCRLDAPEVLREKPADVVVVMSRGFAKEIVSEAKSLAPGAEILLYTDLMARTNLRAAA